MTKVNVSKRVKGLLAGGFLVGSLLASGLACNFDGKDIDRQAVNTVKSAAQTVQTGIEQSKDMAECMVIESGEFAGLLHCADEQNGK